MTTPFTASIPLFFESNRVWRCYTGGMLLDTFLGHTPAADTHFPEDWLASCVLAVNGEHAQGAEEGLSRLRVSGDAPGPLLRDVIAAAPQDYLGSASEMSLLCKYLDSEVRLPIQCHPDQEFARRHYASEHGKSESWLILGTRTIAGEEPYLLMGFKPGISQEEFARVVLAQDTEAMEAMLHRFPVKPGETYFIPGRFPHAIGPGVFLLEVQEPSDWVVQPEHTCAGQELTAADMWGPLDPETALTCFRYEGESAEQIRARLQKHPVEIRRTDGGSLSRVIGSEATTCFGVDHLAVTGKFILEHSAPYYLVVVTSGAARIAWGDGEASVRQGDVFLVPYGVRQLTFQAGAEPLEAYICLPAGGSLDAQ
ncbi:MAG: class I mannose-6-phosphate isomerase [Janthinobacterium lividum]